MSKQQNEYTIHKTGDKVQIRSGEYKGHRGVIQRIEDEQLAIQLQTGEIVSLKEEDVTNFSLAARKAWQKMRSQPPAS